MGLRLWYVGDKKEKPLLKVSSVCPKVSIVLPTYNGHRFLRQALDSLVGQMFDDWELIIVNDCSTDETGEIADEYAKKDKRIRVIHNKTNKKLPASLNIGFADATGEYFTWTSDDNIAKPNWLRVMIEYLDKNPDVDMVSAAEDYIDESGNVIGQTKLSRGVKGLITRNNVGAAFMYRQAIAKKIGPYDENTFCAEDYDYWCRIALAGILKFIPDNIYLYRFNPWSLTSLQQQNIRQKTGLVQQKYYRDFIRKFNVGYWDVAKIEYLLKSGEFKPVFIAFDIYKFMLRLTTSILLFWNRDIRHSVYSKFEIQL